jgi:hypothetical protein
MYERRRRRRRHDTTAESPGAGADRAGAAEVTGETADPLDDRRSEVAPSADNGGHRPPVGSLHEVGQSVTDRAHLSERALRAADASARPKRPISPYS